jgi:hypothetical protein
MSLFLFISIVAALYIVVLLAYLAAKRFAYFALLRKYAAASGPIVVATLHEGDQDELRRCQSHKELLEASGNRIYQRLPVDWEGEQLTFVHPIIFRYGYATETWEEYVDRLEVEERAYTERFHRWLRSHGDEAENKRWYTDKIMGKMGADFAADFIKTSKPK